MYENRLKIRNVYSSSQFSHGRRNCKQKNVHFLFSFFFSRLAITCMGVPCRIVSFFVFRSARENVVKLSRVSLETLDWRRRTRSVAINDDHLYIYLTERKTRLFDSIVQCFLLRLLLASAEIQMFRIESAQRHVFVSAYQLEKLAHIEATGNTQCWSFPMLST